MGRGRCYSARRRIQPHDEPRPRHLNLSQHVNFVTKHMKGLLNLLRILIEQAIRELRKVLLRGGLAIPPGKAGNRRCRLNVPLTRPGCRMIQPILEESFRLLGRGCSLRNGAFCRHLVLLDLDAGSFEDEPVISGIWPEFELQILRLLDV